MKAAVSQASEVDLTRRGIVLVYQLCMGRTPAAEEIDIWVNHLANGLPFVTFLRDMSDSHEARERRKSAVLLNDLADGEFIQLAYEAVLGRGCSCREIELWEQQLAEGSTDRTGILQLLFKDSAAKLRPSSGSLPLPELDGLTCQVLGTNRKISVPDWEDRAREIALGQLSSKPLRQSHARFFIHQEPNPLVSAVASLYRGGKYIERFMENITSQTCFRDYCELVIVDANSPEHESDVIERYCRKFPNVVYHRVNYRIGIYDAWNIGVKIARGVYCTSTNLDDLRRNDSLELQAATLDNLPFVDVVYQDFLYTFDPDLEVKEIEQFGFVSELPVVTAENMMYFNSPHNAPMWRKALHDELGYFDSYYKSAGDYDFWMRCLVAGKVFYKLNDPHAVYFQNPEGLSTRPESRGVDEANHVLKKYGRRLVSANVVMPRPEFAKHIALDPSVDNVVWRSRYQLAQTALRQSAMRLKYSNAHPKIGSGR